MRLSLLTAALLIGSAALAQGPGGPPSGGPPPQPPAKYRPIFTLIGDVMTLERLTGSGKLKLAATEKKPLRTLLVGLAAKKNLSPTEATAATQKLKNTLSAAHRKQLASLRGPGGMPPPPPPGDGPPPGPPPEGGPDGPPPMNGGGPPGRPPGGGLFEALQSGKPFNPLAASDPVAGRAVKTLIARLAK